MSMNGKVSSVEELPPPFLSAMRTLFEILDDQKKGLIKLSDIEKHWREDEGIGIPKGVIESLKKVTPNNGMLTFERFCAGLKICLLRNRNDANKNKQTNVASVKPLRPTSAPNLDDQFPIPKDANNKFDVPVNDIPLQYRAISMPQLVKPRENENRNLLGNKAPPKVQKPRNPLSKSSSGPSINSGVVGPPKPPRDRFKDKQEIRAALHHWQLGMMASDSESGKSGSDVGDPAKNIKIQGHKQGQIGSTNIQAKLNDGKPSQQQPVLRQQATVVRKPSTKRREPRRHTVHNGVDYNMLKRLKQIEQERDILLQGLQAIERAKDWYIQQIVNVEDKLKFETPVSEYSTEALQERLNFQSARIFEVNQHLMTLIESTEKGFPLHMNLAIQRPLPYYMGDTGRVINRLKEQNKLLTEEVGKKSEKITLLEKEKSALIRELFQSRSQGRHPVSHPQHNETTLM